MQLALGYKVQLRKIDLRLETETGQNTRRLETRVSSHNFTLHLSLFIAMTINGLFCGFVGLSCTWNLTRRWCWSIVVWNSNHNNSTSIGSICVQHNLRVLICLGACWTHTLAANHIVIITMWIIQDVFQTKLDNLPVPPHRLHCRTKRRRGESLER